MIPASVNFNNIYMSLTTVFCVIFAEDWNFDMYKNVVPFGTSLHYYAMFFVIVFAFGNYVLFALFAAILLSHFDSDEADEEEEEEEAKEPDEFDESSNKKKGFCARLFSQETYESLKWGFIDMFGKRLREKPTPACESPDPRPVYDDEKEKDEKEHQTEVALRDGMTTERRPDDH